MAKRNGSGKPVWKEGKDFPLFSGKKWKTLEDIWPAPVRVSSEAWKILSVFAPALKETQRFYFATYGHKITAQDLFLLAWMQRCEEINQNVALKAYPVLHGLHIGGKLFYIRKANLTRYGLLENTPTIRRLYRITGTGKMLLRKFVEEIEKAHKYVVEMGARDAVDQKEFEDAGLRAVITEPPTRAIQWPKPEKPK